MQPLRNTSRDYSLVRSGARRDTRYSPERLSPGPMGSTCYSSTRTNDGRRQSWMSNERCISPNSPYNAESHGQRRGTFAHSRRSDPSPGRSQDSSSGEYPFPNRSGARSYEDDYRSSHERFSRAVERSHVRPGSPSRSDRRSSGLGHSLDRGYRRVATDYSVPREDHYKPPSRADRPSAMQSSNGGNHIPLSDRCDGPSPGRRHDSNDDRRRSRSLSPPVGNHSGRKPLPFGESSCDGRRQPLYRGETGRSSKIDDEPRLSHERRLSQPYNAREDVPASREATSSSLSSRGNLRNVQERDPHVGGLLPLPGGALDEQPASAMVSRDTISLFSPSDSGQALHARLNEQSQSSVQVGKTRPANQSPGAVHLGASSVEPRPVPPSGHGTASSTAQSTSKTGKASGSPVSAHSGLSAESRAMPVVREAAGSGRLAQRSAASFAAAVGAKDDLSISKSNMPEVSNVMDSAATTPTVAKGESSFRSISAITVESAPPENSQVIQKIDTRVSRWSYSDAQSAVRESQEKGEEGSSRVQSSRVVHERSVQQQLTQKQHAPAKQHLQQKQQNHSGQHQQLPTNELQKQVQSPQQLQKRPHLSPKKQVPGPQQQQPLAKKQLLSGQSISARDCKVAEMDCVSSAIEAPSGVLGFGHITRNASTGAGNTTSEQTQANGESVLRHGTASTAEAASLGNNQMSQKNDTRVTRWSSPGIQPVALAYPEIGEVGSHQQQASALPGGKAMQTLQQQPLSQKQILAGQQPLSKQQGQSGQQQQPSKDSLHKLGQPPKRQPNLQLLTKQPLLQQLPQKRQPQAVEQPKKAVAAGSALPALGHNANSLSTDQQVSESQPAVIMSPTPATGSLQLGLFGSIPPLHEVSCGTANASSEPASSDSLAEVALTGASLAKEEKSVRASRWSVESPENREVRSPGSLCSARSDNAGKLQQQEQLPHLHSLQARQQRQEHSEQQLLQRAHDQSQQLGRQPKQQHQSGQLQTKPKQQQYMGQQQQQRQVMQMQPRINVAGPSSPLLPLPSQCIGGGLLPLPTVQAVVTIPSPFGPLTGVVPITVPVVSTTVTPRGTFQPKPIWQQPRRPAVGHAPATRNMFSNRQQVSYGDLPDLSPSGAVSHAGVAVASSAGSTATSTAAAAAAVGATTATDSVSASAAAAAGAAAILSGDTAVVAAGASGSSATAATAGVVATIDGTTNATTTSVTQAHRTSNVAATPFNTVRPVPNPSSALISSACSLFSSSTSPQAVAAAGVVVDNIVSATSGSQVTRLSSTVYPVACQPTAVSGLQVAVPTDGTANMLDARENGEAGLFGNCADKASSADIPLNGASSARSREQAILQSAIDSKAAPEQESSGTVAPSDEIAIVSEASAEVVVSSCLDPHVDTHKSKVYCPSSSKIVRAAEGSLTEKGEAQETGLCQLSVNTGTLPPPTIPLVVETRSNDSLNFEVPAVAAISDPEKQSVQGDTSAVATPSSPSLKQYSIGVSVTPTAHVKPMRKCSALVDLCTEEPPLSVPTSLLHCDSTADPCNRHTFSACDTVVAVSSDTGAESPSELITTGTCQERLDCKSVLSSEMLPVASSSESSTPANLCLKSGASSQGCSVTQQIKNRSDDHPTNFVAHLELVSSEEYRHAEMIQSADAAAVSVNRDDEGGLVREEPGKAVTPDLRDSPTNSLLPKELEKPVVTEPSSGFASAVAPPVLDAVRESDVGSSDSTFIELSSASMCGMKRVSESSRHEESSETPSKRRRKTDKKINDDKECEGKCSQALDEQEMGSSESAVSAHHNTFSNQNDAGRQDTTVHAKQSGSRCALDHNTVAGDIVSKPTDSSPIVSSDSIPGDFSATSIVLGLAGNETGRAIPDQAHNDAVNLSDSRLRELLLAHLQNFIDSGVGPFAAVKESRDAALRHYNSFRERFEKMSTDLERASRRLPEPPQVAESHHSASELEVVSTQRTRPRVRTVGTQIRTCQGGPTGAVPVCAMCSTRFQIRSSQLPTSSSTQGSRNSLDTHGVVDLTIDEMPVSPSKSMQPAQSNEAKSGTFGVPDVPCVPHPITRLTTETHSPALVSTVTVTSGSMSVVTAAAVAGAMTTSFGSTVTAVVSQQANNACGVRCDPAIPGEQSGAAGMPGRYLTPQSVLNTVGSSGTAKAMQAQLLPAGPPSLSTSCGVRPLAADLPGSNSANLPADNNPEDVNRTQTEHLGTGTTLSALAVPSTSAIQIDSGLEANGKNLDADESLDKPSVGDHARRLRVDEPQQLSSEKATVSTEVGFEKKQEESQPLTGEEMPMQPENEMVVQHDLASRPSDKADFSTSETASPRSPLVQWPPPLPSDSDEERAVSGHNGRRPPSPYLEAKWTSDGLELQWNMDITSCLNAIVKYEVFASKNKSAVRSLLPWTKIGSIDALPLPMSCCLNLKRSTAYCFAVRAVDSEGVVGTFSNPRTADLCE